MPAIPVEAAEYIIRAGRRMDQRGWVPATAGNISVRIKGPRIAITRSGGHKGFLDSFSVIEVDLDGTPVARNVKPSAETRTSAPFCTATRSRTPCCRSKPRRPR